MNNEHLKKILNGVPDEYEIQISVNEEYDVLSHVFIDDDCGVVDLTNFKDDSEQQTETLKIVDMFDNIITLKTQVLFIKQDDKLGVGTVIDIIENKYDTTLTLNIREKKTMEIWRISVSKDKTESNNKIIRFDW